MKLALLTQHFAPHFEGGTEALVRAQARVLADEGHDVLVVAGTDRPHAGADVEVASVDGLAVRFVPRLPAEPYDLVLERPRVAALVRDLVADRDLVHVHHHSTLHGALVRDAAADGRPVVWTLHDLFATCPRFFRVPPLAQVRCGGRDELEPCVGCIEPDAGGAPPEALAAGLRARAIGFRAEVAAASLVCFPSAAHRDRVRGLVELDAKRARIVPNGLVRDLGRVVTRGWDPAEPLRVLYLGHLAAVKGLDDVVVALAALAPGERERVELHCLGSEVDEGLAGRLDVAARSLAIHRHGGFTPDELEARAAALAPHLAVLPSRAYESYGLTLDECHALGLPTWVGDRGALAERVGSAGRVLPARDPAAWTAAFREVLAEPRVLERERLAVPAELPGPRASAHALLAEYHRLLSSRPPDRP